MSIKIIKDGIEIPIELSTLKVNKEKSTFSNKLSITKSSHPFNIIESPETVEALGPPIIQSINKTFNDVLFVNDNKVYQAELIIRGYPDGVRRCDIRYTNEVYPHLKRKIATYFSDVSIEGTTPQPYKKNSEVDFSDYSWQGYVENIISKEFPATDFNFPTLKFPDKFGAELKSDDYWYRYNGEINQKTEGIVSLNSITNTEVINQNVVIPYYYLLSPLFKIFKDGLGYTVSGTFVEDEAIKKTMLYHESDNLVEIIQPEGNEDDNWLTVFRQHLTINASRFLPNWTTAQYLNHLKNTRNVNIDINDVTKEIVVNYSEHNLLNSKPLDITNYNYNKNPIPKSNTNRGYLLKSLDEKDFSLITLDTIENSDVVDEYTVTLTSQFKAVPEVLSLEWSELSGTGILFYDYLLDNTYQVQEVANKTNSIWGPKGILETCWKLWFRMRLRSKDLPLNLICSTKQKTDLQRANNVYVFHQEFLIKKWEFEEVGRDYKVKLDLISLSY